MAIFHCLTDFTDYAILIFTLLVHIPPFLICLANPDQDYNTVFTNLTFSSTVTSQAIDVTINDDEIDENDESFFGILLPSTNPRVLLDPSQAEILIRGRDGK